MSRNPAYHFRCFCFFGGKLSASDLSFTAEILDFRRRDKRNNSEAPAVFSLFPAVFTHDRPRKNITRW